MTTDSAKPLADVDPSSVTAGDVDEAEIRAALASSNPLTRQEGVELCETLATERIDDVRPFLDEVAALADDSNAAIALRAISVLDAVAGAEPAALDGRLDGLVGVLDTHIVDVQLTGATALGKLVVERPDLVAPHTGTLIRAVGVTEPTPGLRDFGDVVDDPVTQQTLQEHEEEERKRRASGRRTLINVVVAVTETEPDAVPDVVDDLVSLLDDVDPGITGGAVDALAELAAADPERIAPALEPLIDCLDHNRTTVRARAIRALGHLGDDAPVPELRALAEEDDDEEVREIAAETAAFLADSA